MCTNHHVAAYKLGRVNWRNSEERVKQQTAWEQWHSDYHSDSSEDEEQGVMDASGRDVLPFSGFLNCGMSIIWT